MTPSISGLLIPRPNAAQHDANVSDSQSKVEDDIHILTHQL